ncbi:tripartite tricarboxylate transporter permease [Haematobacter massiliensis]|uniref:Tripartite tricarboxylate transporter TctA n=1 Tax=Haematobacter massiliensis TaxID=195105 RepID=A0A086Y0M6_9RHOB|nr:tripartite tricarboxylate transporter permease [Haematobacter massiliensis]KFI27826.1 tripartite tricarboxylate transporter TctA [Haematobacter massiliensis]OWJ70410.1 tripartite tricarboxylate transporter permease [Haematobacter massiliensis]OWJ86728.1 tripartite tricarboxylate transporter permease [Haematobacter massiliensis]QBJ25130.1 tripartite tricarboxylate transporter permease [Haematobacter massiliensis]
MTTFDFLLQGLAIAMQPMNLLYALIGVTLGTAVGVLPGIGPALTVALLLPVTYKLDPAGSLIMFAGIYYGGMYGGSTTSILLNTPGESASIITALEGNRMARKGRGGPALATAAIGSFVAGLIATLLLAFVAPIIVKLALVFGPREYFALMVLAFVTVSSAFGESALRGLTSLFLGLGLAVIGIDQLSGQARLSFGMPELLDGVEVTTLAVAMFAIGEALYLASQRWSGKDEVIAVKGSLWMNRQDWKRSWRPWLRGTAIGFPIGAMPAGGAEIGTFLSYAVEKKMTKHPEEFGEGAIEGVAGPEAANNASAAGTLVPLLTLGLPTTATAAIMLAGFQQFGLQPGPLLFATNPTLVWGLVASLLIANAMLLVLNLPLIGLWVKLLTIPRPWLYAGILLFATLGTIGANPSVFELAMLLAFGLLGFVMRLFGYPIAPIVVGLILGPLAEQQLRRALAISQGDWTVLVSSPVSAGLMTVAVLAFVVPMILRIRGRGKVLSQLAADED